MKVSGSQRRTIPAARPSVPASGQQLHAAQRVGAESRSRTGSRRAGLGGRPWLASANCFFLSSLIKAVC